MPDFSVNLASIAREDPKKSLFEAIILRYKEQEVNIFTSFTEKIVNAGKRGSLPLKKGTEAGYNFR